MRVIRRNLFYAVGLPPIERLLFAKPRAGTKDMEKGPTVGLKASVESTMQSQTRESENDETDRANEKIETIEDTLFFEEGASKENQTQFANDDKVEEATAAATDVESDRAKSEELVADGGGEEETDARTGTKVDTLVKECESNEKQTQFANDKFDEAAILMAGDGTFTKKSESESDAEERAKSKELSADEGGDAETDAGTETTEEANSEQHETEDTSNEATKEAEKRSFRPDETATIDARTASKARLKKFFKGLSRRRKKTSSQKNIDHPETKPIEITPEMRSSRRLGACLRIRQRKAAAIRKEEEGSTEKPCETDPDPGEVEAKFNEICASLGLGQRKREVNEKEEELPIETPPNKTDPDRSETKAKSNEIRPNLSFRQVETTAAIEKEEEGSTEKSAGDTDPKPSEVEAKPEVIRSTPSLRQRIISSIKKKKWGGRIEKPEPTDFEAKSEEIQDKTNPKDAREQEVEMKLIEPQANAEEDHQLDTTSDSPAVVSPDDREPIKQQDQAGGQDNTVDTPGTSDTPRHVDKVPDVDEFKEEVLESSLPDQTKQILFMDKLFLLSDQHVEENGQQLSQPADGPVISPTPDAQRLTADPKSSDLVMPIKKEDASASKQPSAAGPADGADVSEEVDNPTCGFFARLMVCSPVPCAFDSFYPCSPAFDPSKQQASAGTTDRNSSEGEKGGKKDGDNVFCEESGKEDGYETQASAPNHARAETSLANLLKNRIRQYDETSTISTRLSLVDLHDTPMARNLIDVEESKD